MVTIRNKFVVLAAVFWVLGVILIVLGAYGRSAGWGVTPTLFTAGILAQAAGFGFLGYVIIQAAFSKKK
jgi:hypothetical protein